MPRPTETSTVVRARPGPINTAEAEARHQRILSAARTLFVTRGLAGTSFDAIARAARVTKRTIYQLYQNKEGLFVAALTDCVDTIARGVRQVDEQTDLTATLVGLAQAYARALDNPETLSMYRLAIGEAGRMPAAARHAINLYGEHSALGVITALLDRAQVRGLVRFKSLDAFAHLFLDLILTPHFMRWLIDELPPAEDKTSDVVRFLRAASDLFESPAT